MIEVLNASGGIDTYGLKLAAGARADPNRLPRRRNHQRFYSFEAVFAANEFSVGIEVFEAFGASSFPPPPFRSPVTVDGFKLVRNLTTSLGAKLSHCGEYLCTPRTL